LNALSLAVLLFAQGAGADGPRGLPDPFSREGICAFAEHLDAEGDASDAAAEFARCLFLSEAADSSLHPELRRRRIRALLRAGAPDPAYSEFRAWARADTGSLLRETAYALGKELVRADRDSLVPPLLAALSVPAAPDSIQARLRLLEASAWLRLGNGDSARTALARASREGGKEAEPSIALVSGLAGEARNGIGGHRWLAGLLSACVPGLGKVYAGRPVDGGATLLVLAFLGWQAWDGYAHDGPASVKGAIFAASTAGLYAGNVYGSMRAVDVENEKRRKAYAERIKFAVAFRLP
jgi:hypothetical protein